MTDAAPPYISNRPPRPVRRAREQFRAENTPLLREVGRIVRSERLKRGMTRKLLAKHAGTSERYLGQVELGDANPSLLVLDAIARGLGVDLFDLVPAVGPDEARRRAFAHLRQLPASEVRNWLQMFSRDIGPFLPPIDTNQRGRRVALIGLRGAGKSTLGALLAQRLGCAFVELDKIIEQDHGARVPILFEVYGQATFRRYERDALSRVVTANDNAVIATAGSIVADTQTLAQLLEQTYVIWVKATPDEHMRRVLAQGDFRPMAHNPDAMNDLVAILNARAVDYGRAHAQLDTSGKSAEACLEELSAIAARLFTKASFRPSEARAGTHSHETR
jgi:XRE family transcriptional regulator, aerobic/anaerobic benzoate catabolism transcriptional regulator